MMDWLNKWKEYFKPFRIDDTIVIKPVWEEFAIVNGDLSSILIRHFIRNWPP